MDLCVEAKLRVISRTGKISSITRPVQKIIPLEVQKELSSEPAVVQVEQLKNEEPKETLNDTQRTRPTKKAAVDGQYERRLRQKFY